MTNQYRRNPDPETYSTYDLIDKAEAAVKIVTVIISILGIIFAFIAATAVEGHFETYYDSEVTINFFGLEFYLDEEINEEVAPAIAFSYVMMLSVIADLFVMLIGYIIRLNAQKLKYVQRISSLLEDQASGGPEIQSQAQPHGHQNDPSAHHTWRCEKCGSMTDSTPCSSCGHVPNGSPNPTPFPQKVYPNSSGKIFCPTCGTEQNGDRYRCLSCGQVFINGQPGIPYWCGNCGTEGPYAGTCPNCGKDTKVHNN